MLQPPTGLQDIVFQWGGAGLNKVKLELKLLWKGCSGFTLIDGLEYLGFPLSYVSASRQFLLFWQDLIYIRLLLLCAHACRFLHI